MSAAIAEAVNMIARRLNELAKVKQRIQIQVVGVELNDAAAQEATTVADIVFSPPALADLEPFAGLDTFRSERNPYSDLALGNAVVARKDHGTL